MGFLIRAFIISKRNRSRKKKRKDEETRLLDATFSYFHSLELEDSVR